SMSFSSQEDQLMVDRQSSLLLRLNQARSYYEDEQHSDVSVIILHMSELLSSFVREDTPEKRAEWSRALSDIRNGMATHHSHEELKFITDFSIMLEEGLQCLASKCAKLEQAVKNPPPPREHDYVFGNWPLMPRSPIDVAVVKLPKRLYDLKNQLVVCDFCKGTKFARLRYHHHLRHVHPEEFEKIAKCRCQFCKSALFISEKALEAHLETCKIRIEHDRMMRRMPGREQLICRMCHLSCATLKDLSLHTEKEHPHIQILSCTGCGQLFKGPGQLVEHWKNAGLHSHPRTKCAMGCPATLVSRHKLISQLLVRAKATRDKTFSYIECMTQKLPCQVCGVICESFVKLYSHTHQRHNKVQQAVLNYGCLGCGNKYKCVPSLKEHLMRSEIEEYETCRNAGVVYWGETLMSKDMRPKEAIEREEKREAVKKEEIETMEKEEMEKKEIKVEVEMEIEEEMEMEIVRSPVEQSMEMDAGFSSMDEMPTL
ncbi:hypothetical protein PENTCL1PPCAC_27604, partial [Pristionchus entomophagus]